MCGCGDFYTCDCGRWYPAVRTLGEGNKTFNENFTFGYADAGWKALVSISFTHVVTKHHAEIT